MVNIIGKIIDKLLELILLLLKQAESNTSKAERKIEDIQKEKHDAKEAIEEGDSNKLADVINSRIHDRMQDDYRSELDKRGD